MSGDIAAGATEDLARTHRRLPSRFAALFAIGVMISSNLSTRARISGVGAATRIVVERDA